MTGYYYGGSGGINDSANFIYSGGKLTKVQANETYVIYSYPANRISAMKYYETPGNILYRMDSFFYVNDTQISKVIINDYDIYYGTDSVRSELQFSFNNTKLSSILNVSQYAGVPDIDTTETTFRWTGNNVNRIVITSNYRVTDSVMYQYDNNANYFRKISPNLFMTDPFFQLYVGLEPHLALFISNNNVINFRTYGTLDYPVQSERDSMQRPVLIRSGGDAYVGYKYECL